MDPGAMAMKSYSGFPKAPALLEPHHQTNLMSCPGHLLGSVLPLSRDAVSVFYSPCRQMGKSELIS